MNRSICLWFVGGWIIWDSLNAQSKTTPVLSWQRSLRAYSWRQLQVEFLKTKRVRCVPFYLKLTTRATSPRNRMRMLQVLQRNKVQCDLYTTAPTSATPWERTKAREVVGLRMFYVKTMIGASLHVTFSIMPFTTISANLANLIG